MGCDRPAAYDDRRRFREPAEAGISDSSDAAKAMVDLEMLFALAVAGSVLGPGILCGIAAIYDGYDRHRCLLRRVLRASAFVAVAFFATLLGLIAAESGAPPEVRWDWLALLVATTMAFTVSLLPGIATYLTVFHLSARLQAPVEPLPSPPPPVQETGNPYQPPPR